MCALSGYFIGTFGKIVPVFWDVSAFFAGITAAVFPAARSQPSRIQKQRVGSKVKNKGKDWLMYLIILALISILAITTKSLPWLSFLVLFFLVLCGSIAYYYAPIRDHHRIKIKLHFENLGFVLILLVAMICLELGRNNGIANIAMWGVFLLLIFLAVLAFLLKHSKHTFFDAASKQIYWQMMMYGVCAQFWITYSAVFVSIVHGAQNFYFVFIAYLAGIILAKPALSFIYLRCSLKPLTINVIGKRQITEYLS